MRRKTYSLIILCIAILAVWLAPRIIPEDTECSGYEFVEVIDGDTLAVMYEGERVSVRLIGMDAPESVHPDESRNTEDGVLAAEHLEQMTNQAEQVYLEFDVEPYDTYGRLLAYVYLEEEAEFEESLNYRMTEEGYAVNKE